MPNSSSFPIGSEVNICQMGAGQVTVAGSGVSILSTPGAKLRAQYSAATLKKIQTMSWLLMGDLTS